MKVRWYELTSSDETLVKNNTHNQEIDEQLYKRTLGQYILSPKNRNHLDAVPRWIRNIEENTIRPDFAEKSEWSEQTQKAFEGALKSAFDALLEASLNDLVTIYIGTYKPPNTSEQLHETLRLKRGKDWKLHQIENDSNRAEFIGHLMRADKPDIFSIQQQILQEGEKEYDDDDNVIGVKSGKLLSQDELFKPISNIRVEFKPINEGKANEETELSISFRLDHTNHIPHTKILSEAFPNQKVTFSPEDETLRQQQGKVNLKPQKFKTGETELRDRKVPEEDLTEEELATGQDYYYSTKETRGHSITAEYGPPPEYIGQLKELESKLGATQILQLDAETRTKLKEVFENPINSKAEEWVNLMIKNNLLYTFLINNGMPISVILAGRYDINLILRDVKLKENIEVNNKNKPIWVFDITSKFNTGLLMAPAGEQARQKFNIGIGKPKGTTPQYAYELPEGYAERKKEIAAMPNGPKKKAAKEKLNLEVASAKEGTRGLGHNESREYLMDVIQARIGELRIAVPYLGSGPNG